MRLELILLPSGLQIPAMISALYRLISSKIITQETPRAVLLLGSKLFKPTSVSASLDSYEETTWNWKVTYAGLDPTFNNVFYLAVISEDGSDSFTSHYFNISSESTATSATAAATSSSPLSSASPSSTTSQSPPPPPATVTVAAPNTNNGGTPTGTIAGVVGALVGTLLLVGGAWWAWKTKKKGNNGNTARAQQPVPPNFEPPFHTEPRPYEVDGNQTYEMHETERGRMFELQETERRRMCELEGSGRDAHIQN
ncbi:MAG: hypothetical protein Q9178_007605 [Gyalolechia marmorata]